MAETGLKLGGVCVSLAREGEGLLARVVFGAHWPTGMYVCMYARQPRGLSLLVLRIDNDADEKTTAKTASIAVTFPLCAPLLPFPFRVMKSVYFQ